VKVKPFRAGELLLEKPVDCSSFYLELRNEWIHILLGTAESAAPNIQQGSESRFQSVCARRPSHEHLDSHDGQSTAGAEANTKHRPLGLATDGCSLAESLAEPGPEQEQAHVRSMLRCKQ